MRKSPGIIDTGKSNIISPVSGFTCKCGKDIPQGAVNCTRDPKDCAYDQFVDWSDRVFELGYRVLSEPSCNAAECGGKEGCACSE